MKLQDILDNRGYSRKQLEKTIEACQEALKNCVD
jgi:glycerophosphoryl diester phosphodiesterase